MNKNIYKIGFFILLVINIVLVVIFTFRPKPPIQQIGIKDEISRELNFTEEQKAKFNEMVKEHQRVIRELDNNERELVKSFFERLASENINGDQEVLIHEILQLEKDKIMATYNHFEELKGICVKEQLVKYDSVIQRVIPILTNSSERSMKPDKPPF